MRGKYDIYRPSSSPSLPDSVNKLKLESRNLLTLAHSHQRTMSVILHLDVSSSGKTPKPKHLRLLREDASLEYLQAQLSGPCFDVVKGSGGLKGLKGRGRIRNLLKTSYFCSSGPSQF